jgi:hypothetical protein
MPLTFAHPAAVLPFSNRNKFVHFTAMVLGSMAPDFEYFLRGQPIGEYGHTFLGFLLLNLPLVFVVYLIYNTIINPVLVEHLPVYIEDRYRRLYSREWHRWLVFSYSALFGMFTHVAWDSFTHYDGFMVMNFPMFTHTFSLYSFKIPLYKILQHGSTLFGLSLIVGFILFRVSVFKAKLNLAQKRIIAFWLLLLIMTLISTCVWYILSDVTIKHYGILVVRIIDSFFISLLIISCSLRLNEGIRLVKKSRDNTI